MSQNLPRTLAHSLLGLLVLMAPPVVSDAVEQKAFNEKLQFSHKGNEADDDGRLLQLVSESWRKGTIDAAFLLNKNLDSGDIQVSVMDATAILKGKVDSSIKKSLAEQIALSVEGIKKVTNLIAVNNEIRQAPPQLKTDHKDALLMARINQTLLGHEHLQTSFIDVHAHDGVVELSGNAPEEAIKDLAYYLAKNVRGVKSVDNKIKVRTTVY